MVRICRTCSRINSSEASFCYFDGAWLGAAGGSSGPLAIGTMLFPSPFVFPSGRVSRSFDELALGCEAEWEEAQKLLGTGFFEGFLAALGRADLGQAARRAQRNPDRDRGLDQFLAQLPGDARKPPNLVVQPREINLGHLAPGETRRFSLQLENGGMGLLHGTAIVEDAAWLVLGEGAGTPRKVFQFRHDLILPVQILGKRLRAANRALDGQIVIESSGGTQTVAIRGEVPVRPFPTGPLAGAATPREIAEKARASPKEAAALFESGTVASWYQTNGWNYPVQGPAASGVGAVQQFFEALGLARAPRVEISHRSLVLSGPPGATIDEVIHVRTVEKRPVFAHAISDVPWLKVKKVQLDGRTAYIGVQVPMVPVRPNEELRGYIHVTANGDQRFAVETILRVEASATPQLLPRDGRAPSAYLDGTVGRDSRKRTARVPAAVVAAFKADRPDEENEPARTTRLLRSLLHVLPLLFLLLGLAGTLAHDFLQPKEKPTALVDTTLYLTVRFHDGPDTEKILPPATMRFGLVMPEERDPDDPRRNKLLTFDEHGRTNNACVRVDGGDFLFGEPPGTWVERSMPLGPDATGRERDGRLSTWELLERKLRVTQRVEIVPGESSNRLDTCQVRYILENLDGRPHTAGIRFLLDTFIGANDGVPFTIPGMPGLCDTMMELGGKKPVPDFIQAQEYDNLSKPGTVAHLQFRLGAQIEAPSRVTLGGWPNQSLRHFRYPQAKGEKTLWDVPLVPINELQRRARESGQVATPDSAVTMYWPERSLPPGGKREVGFQYGLGEVANGEGEGRLLLSVGGRFVRDGVFTLTALVRNPRPGEKLTVTLPEGFELLEGNQEQPVPAVPADAPRPISPVTWQIRARKDGRAIVQVKSSAGAAQKLTLTIRSQGIFD